MIRYQLFAARDGDVVDDEFDIEPSGSDLIDGSVAEGRAAEIVCKAFRLDESAYENWDDLVADLDGARLRPAGTVETTPSGPALPQPLPVDLIVAARDVIAAFGGDVPDWIANQVGMLELALQPFAQCDIPLPQDRPLQPGDTLFLRQLEQRDRVVMNNLIVAHWRVLQDVYGEEFDDDAVEAAWREFDVDYNDIGCLAVAKDEAGKITELWVSDRGGMDDGDEYTLVWQA